MDDQTSSPMKGYAPPPTAGAADESGGFYGGNMPAAVSNHAPTPSSAIPSWVQFGPGTSERGPMDSPFATAINVGSTPAGGEGGGHAESPLDTPMGSGIPMSVGGKS